jgi:hypothetical protein
MLFNLQNFADNLTFQYEEEPVHSRQNQATENDPGFDKAGTNK